MLNIMAITAITTTITIMMMKWSRPSWAASSAWQSATGWPADTMATIMAIRPMAMVTRQTAMATATAPATAMPIHVTATPTPNQDTATLTRAMATRHIHHRRSMATATGLMASIRTGPITGNATTAAIEHVAGELIRALRYPRGRGKAP